MYEYLSVCVCACVSEGTLQSQHRNSLNDTLPLYLHMLSTRNVNIDFSALVRISANVSLSELGICESGVLFTRRINIIVREEKVL